MLPLLRQGRDARVVSLSSVAARSGTINFEDLQSRRYYTPMVAYGQSKLACLSFALELQRRSDAEDGRRLQIVLTAKGARLAESLFDQHTQWIGGLFNGLDASEQAQLSHLLTKVWQHTDSGRDAMP